MEDDINNLVEDLRATEERISARETTPVNVAKSVILLNVISRLLSIQLKHLNKDGKNKETEETKNN